MQYLDGLVFLDPCRLSSRNDLSPSQTIIPGLTNVIEQRIRFLNLKRPAKPKPLSFHLLDHLLRFKTWYFHKQSSFTIPRFQTTAAIPTTPEMTGSDDDSKTGDLERYELHSESLC